MKDPEYLVRNHACESLLFLHGFKPEIAEHEEIFQNITSPQGLGSVPTEDDVKRYESAIIQLKDLFKSKKSYSDQLTSQNKRNERSKSAARSLCWSFHLIK